jgi:hypothetical protein
VTEHQRFIIRAVEMTLGRIERRLVGSHNAVTNATRNTDRLVIANDMSSIRLEIENTRRMLQELLAESTDIPVQRHESYLGERDRSEH